MRLPTFTDDDVIQFWIAESMVARGQADAKKAERDNARKNNLKNHRAHMAKAGMIPNGGV